MSTRQHFETQLTALVEKFARRRAEYTRADYSEFQTRIDFIDPFFEALGWDVRNTQHASERDRDVVVESGATRGRPDYNFRLNGRTQFFVEAKAPHVSLDASKVILQAKRYAFNETSQTVILTAATDFEEFRLYEVRDISYLRHPNKGLAFAYRSDEYLTPRALDDLWKLSRESVAAGSLDTLVSAATRRARERVSLDQQFLSDLADWRERLAKAIFKNHPELDARDLNSIVQVFLDRLIFIRVAEDRGVLPEGQLIEIARHWRQSEQSKPLTTELLPLFRSVNRALNGEIFKPHQCEDLDWDSAIVAAIIDDGLEPYNFAQIGVEMLGSIYERYLGKTIRVTATRALVEDKPEVRKAGGVYYTPKHIVDYIVQNTIGKLIEGKTPKQIEKLRVLDPACGSGSFLLGAYQTLLDYHARYFAERANHFGGGGNGGQPLLLREARPVYGEFKLSLEQKGEILRNNIFGVDIDPQAVEITMMSLYIKMLEGERGAITGQGVLPRLKDNIKCGNSLIGYDIGALTADERARINPFDWQSASEGFGAILAEGGFDAVIGNPPYGAEFPEMTFDYLKARFKTFVWRGESYMIFIEQAARLLKPGGQFGYIIPDTYLNLGFTQPLRELLLQNTRIREIVTLPSNVFAGATVDTTLLFFEKMNPTQTFHENNVSIQVFDKRQAIDAIRAPQRAFSVSTREWHRQNAFNVSSNFDEMNVLTKIETGNSTIADIAEMFYGIKVYQVGKGNPPQTKTIRDTKPFTSEKQKTKAFLPFFDGKHIGRYELLWERNNWINYGPWLAEPRKPEKYQGEKILIRKIVGKTLIATYVPETSYCNTLLFVLKIKPGAAMSYPFVLGILNSRLIGWYFRSKFQINAADTFPQIMIRDILQFPIPTPDRARHDQLAARVTRMLELQKQKRAATGDVARAQIECEINVTDEQIDALVYALYGLTAEEIKIVEKK